MTLLDPQFPLVGTVHTGAITRPLLDSVCVCVSRARPWAVPGDRTCIPLHTAEAEGGPEAAPVGSAVRM